MAPVSSDTTTTTAFRLLGQPDGRAMAGAERLVQILPLVSGKMQAA